MAEYERVNQDDLSNLRSFKSSAIKSSTVPPNLFGINKMSRLEWDFLVLFFVLFNTFFCVFYLSFECTSLQLPGMKTFGIFTDIVFIFDIYMNSFTTYIDEHTGDEIVSMKKILLRYFKYLFFLDALSAIPIFLMSMSCETLVIFVTIVRLNKLSIISKIVIRLMYFRLRQGVRLVIKCVEMIVWLMIYIHLMACLWYNIVDHQQNWDPYSLLVYGEDFYQQDLNDRYSFCVYTVVSSISRMEMLPNSKFQYFFLGWSIIAGMLIIGILYGNIIVLLQELGKESFKFAEEHEKIHSTIKNLKLPSDLQHEITEFFSSSYTILDQETTYIKVISYLPPSIKKKLNLFLFDGLFSKSKLLANHTKLIHYLTQQLANKFCQPEEEIIKQYEQGDMIYFLSEGRCEVEVLDENKEKQNVKNLEPGAHFGEIGVLFKTARTATVRSLEFSTLAVLSESKLRVLFGKFPEVKRALMASASKYKDRYRIFVDKILAKLGYLQSLDSCTFNKLVYSLPVYSCPAGTDLFIAGDMCNACFMILDGHVQILFEIRGASLLKKLKEKSFRLKNKIKGNKKIKAVNLVIEDLGKGSVIAPNLLVLQQKFAISCRCREQARVMIFHKDHLDEIVQRFPYVKQSIDETISKFTFWDSSTETERTMRIPLDYFKCQKYESEPRKKSMKLRIKFKNAVISKILTHRDLDQNKLPNMRIVIERIQAFIHAEKIGRPDLATKITLGQLQPESIEVGDLLTHKSPSPLLTQFALKSKETHALSELFKAHMKDLSQKFQELKKNAETSQEGISSLLSLFSLIQPMLNK